MKKKRVLFVCLGNICRSPLAEGILKNKIAALGLTDNIVVDSCGTSAYHIGEQPDPRTIANAKENGVLLDHKARQFTVKDFSDFDYILAMDRSNLSNIRRLEGGYSDYSLSLMRDFDPLYPGEDVPDPYYGGPGGFQNVFDILDRSVDKLLNHILEESKRSSD